MLDGDICGASGSAEPPWAKRVVLIWGPGIKSKVLEPSVEPHWCEQELLVAPGDTDGRPLGAQEAIELSLGTGGTVKHIRGPWLTKNLSK